MIFTLLGCSLLGIYFPPEWSHLDVRKTIDDKYCVTGAAKVRRNVRFAEDTAEHRARAKLLDTYAALMYPLSEFLDEQTETPLQIIRTEAKHGVNKGPIQTERVMIEYIPNRYNAKRIWSMYCFSANEDLLAEKFARAWIRVYEAKEKKEREEQLNDEQTIEEKPVEEQPIQEQTNEEENVQTDSSQENTDMTEVSADDDKPKKPSIRQIVFGLIQNYKNKK